MILSQTNQCLFFTVPTRKIPEKKKSLKNFFVGKKKNHLLEKMVVKKFCWKKCFCQKKKLSEKEKCWEIVVRKKKKNQNKKQIFFRKKILSKKVFVEKNCNKFCR